MRPIDADKLIADGWVLERHGVSNCLLSVMSIADVPTIDPDTLRPKGRWVTINKRMNNWVECSECHTVGSPMWKCCPVCEAKMEV